LTAVSISDQRFLPPFLPAIKGFDRRFYRETNVLRAVPTSAQGYGVPCLPFALKCELTGQLTPEMEIRSKKGGS